MEAIPAGGVIDMVNTNSAFAALNKDGSVHCWKEPRCGGKVQGSLPPDAESVHATERAFATRHRGGSVTAWGHPFFGGDVAMVRKELYICPMAGGKC